MKKYLGIFAVIVLSFFINISVSYAVEAVYVLNADEISGTIVGGVTAVSDDEGYVLKFDGTGYIKVGNPSNLNFGAGPFSLEVIFSWNGKSGVNNIIRKSNYPVSGPGAGYWLRIGNDSLEFFAGETSGVKGGINGRVSASVSPNVWHHAIATRGADGTMKLYLDGELKGSLVAPGAETTSPASFTIGAWDDRFGVTETFGGEIDEVIVYNGEFNPPEFPIKELGDCGSEIECRKYCNEDVNIPTCIQYSIDHDLISDEEKIEAEKLLKLMDPSGAPGECATRVECLQLCNSVASSLECIAYAERNGLIVDEELKNAKIMARLLEEGVAFPGGCQTQQQCLDYCNDISRFDECTDFALKAGFVKPNEIEEYKKIQPFLASGETPGGCKTKEVCQAYCENTENIDECFAFAEKVGLIPPGELENAKKAIEFMKRGETPGGCKSKKECEAYCMTESNMDECIEFGLKAGIMTEEEAGFAKKFLEIGGPGGCKSREECDNFCNNPNNQSACFDFAVEAGFIAPEDAEFFREQMAQSGGASENRGGGFGEMPVKIKECIDGRLGAGTVDKLASNKSAPTKEMMSAVRICMEEFQRSCPAFAQMGGDDEHGGEMSGDGARQFNECLEEIYGGGMQEKMRSGDFCPPADFQEKIGACMQGKFGPMDGSKGGDPGGQGNFDGGGFQGGGPVGGFSGPGGCKSQEECMAYCTANPKACQGFRPPSGGGGQYQDQGTEECFRQGGQWDGQSCVFSNHEGADGQYQVEYGQQYQSQYENNYQGQYEQQYQGQYEQQYQSQYEQQYSQP